MAKTAMNIFCVLILTVLQYGVTPATAKPAPETVLYECGFKDGVCPGIENGPGDFNWRYHGGQTPSYQTGPTWAHADSGYFYFESSVPARQGDEATFQISGWPTSHDGPVCVRFYYNMYGSSMGSLTLFKRSGETKTELWALSGDQGTEWQRGQIELENFNTATDTLEWTAVRGSSYLSDIAVDTISISKNCLEDETEEEDNAWNNPEADDEGDNSNVNNPSNASPLPPQGGSPNLPTGNIPGSPIPPQGNSNGSNGVSPTPPPV